MFIFFNSLELFVGIIEIFRPLRVQQPDYFPTPLFFL